MNVNMGALADDNSRSMLNVWPATGGYSTSTGKCLVGGRGRYSLQGSRGTQH